MLNKNLIIINIFLLVVFAYFSLIIFMPYLQPIDDHGILNSLMKDQIFTAYVSQDLFYTGRFYPLNMQEFNLLVLLDIVSVELFYILLAIEFLFIIGLMFLLFIEINNKNIHFFKIFIILLIIFVFSPGFVTAFFRLHIGERNALFFLLLSLLFYLKFQNKPKIIYFLIALIATNFSLYYKEPVFLILGTFAFLHFIFSYKTTDLKQKTIDILIILSSLTFIIVYFFLVYMNQGNQLYGDTPYNPIILMAKNGFKYVMSDPLIVFVVFPLATWRFYNIIKLRQSEYPIYDAMLFASVVYIFAFIKLNICEYHYWLPSYAFAIPALLFFITKTEIMHGVFWKISSSIAVFFILVSSLPIALHLITFYKYVPANYNKALDYVVSDIKQNHITKASIYLENINFDHDMEVYVSFAKFLDYKGLQPADYEMRCNTDKQLLKYCHSNDNNKNKIESGDYLIVTPYSSSKIDAAFIEKLSINYKLLYKTESQFAIPNWNLKTLIKYFSMTSINESNINISQLSQNINRWPDYYVFQHK